MSNPGSCGVSPIPLSEARNPIKFTEPRGHRRWNVGDGSICGNPFPSASTTIKKDNVSDPMQALSSTSIETKGASSGSGIFPYPNILENSKGLDSGQMLCRSLKILATFKKVERENQRLIGKSKRKEKPDEVVQYDFTPDMFVSVNSEAFVHAMYLLFSSIDSKEADLRFRDCWPVYEMKIIGAFRRVVLDWLKELIQAHPQFFRDLKVEALSGLLVNPGGDRFISMMRQFCRLVLFKVANQNKSIVKEQVLLPPNPTPDPEISNRQIHVLHHRKKKHFEKVMKTYTSMLQNHLATERKSKHLENFTQEVLRTESAYSSKLRTLLNGHSHILGNVEDSEWLRRNKIVSQKRLSDLMDNNAHDDDIRSRLDEVVKLRVQEVYDPVSFLQNIMEDYGKIWYILDMDRSNLSVLNCNKMKPHQLMDDRGRKTFNAFIKNLMDSTERLLDDEFLKNQTPTEVLADYKRMCLRLDFLEMLEEKIKQVVVNSEKVAQSRIHRDLLKRRLEGYEWSYLSGVQEQKFNLFEFSPMRVFDINRQTGQTPVISGFLNSPCTSLVGENIGIPKRRNTAGPTTNGVGRKLQLSNEGRKSDDFLRVSVDTPTSSKELPPTGQRVKMSVSYEVVYDNVISPDSSHSDISSGNLTIVGTSDEARPASSLSLPLLTVQTPELDSNTRNPSRSSTTNTNSLDSTMNTSVNERIQRLLESVASPSPGPGSPQVSPINDSTKACANSSTADNSLSHSDDKFTDLVSSFENMSMTRDWDDMKGIMETSHIEMSVNSDSDE